MRDTKLGVGYLVGAMALTPMTDGLSKSLALGHSAFFVTFARYFVAGLIALFFAVLLKKPLRIPRDHRIGQVARTALMMGAMVSLIYALSLVPMAKAVGGFLIAPVVASLISVIFFGEKLGSHRLAGAVLSFIGAYVIVRPQGSFELGTMMALFGGFLLGCYLAATRRAGTSAGLFSTLVVQSFLGCALIAPLAFFHGIPALTPIDIMSILALGAVSSGAHFLTVAAYNRTDSSVLAPFFYFNIVFTIPVGYLWFHEVPDVTTIVGLCGIALGGVLAVLSVRAKPRVCAEGINTSRKFWHRKFLNM